MPIWQLCANLLIPNCLRSNLSYSPLAALELYVKLNNPLHYNSELQEKFSSMLLQGLQEKCEYVLTHRQEVKQKSFACLERIRKFHDPRDYAKKLELIYQGKVSELISKEEYFTLCTS